MLDMDVDILIVGGGVIGATLMLALAPLGLRVSLIDSRSLSTDVVSHLDGRNLALSPASIRILSQLGVWSRMVEFATPIHAIHVSEEGRFGQARLLGSKEQPLGTVVEMQALTKALWSMIDLKHVIAPATLTHYDKHTQTATIKIGDNEGTIRSKMIVAADGSDSVLRQICNVSIKTKNYGQAAIVANIGLARSHQNNAYERFTPNGPMALLPLLGKHVALIWTLPPEEASTLMTSTPDDFLRALQRAFGYRLGRFVSVGQRTSFVLREIRLAHQVVDHVVFVGNAAHTLHPVAGQGFNLGLRDVAALAECIAKSGLSDETFLNYQAIRRSDQETILSFTDGLIRLFTSTIPGVSHLRSLGLMMFDNMPFLKKIMKRYAGGFGGVLPALVCDLPITIEENPHA